MNPMKNKSPRWITKRQASVILECTMQSVSHLLATGRLRARQARFHDRIDRESVLELAKEINQPVPVKEA
jgi:hypothetical protein